MTTNWQAQAADFAAKCNLDYVAGVYALDVISEMGGEAQERIHE